MDTLHFMLDGEPSTSEGIYHVYDLPSIKPAIRYLHVVAGFPTKRTWLKAIRNGRYLTWPLITVKNVNKLFPESDETQQVHMRGQRQVVCSTKPKINEKPQGVQIITEGEKLSEKFQGEETKEIKSIKKENEILIEVYEPKETMYTDQIGKFLHISSQGNRYMMALAHIESDSIWFEPTKKRTEGEMMLSRRRSLQRMQSVGIKPKR